MIHKLENNRGKNKVVTQGRWSLIPLVGYEDEEGNRKLFMAEVLFEPSLER